MIYHVHNIKEEKLQYPSLKHEYKCEKIDKKCSYHKIIHKNKWKILVLTENSTSQIAVKIINYFMTLTFLKMDAWKMSQEIFFFRRI